MKVKIIGTSCSSRFCIILEVQVNDKIQSLIMKLEQIIPCTQIIEMEYNDKILNKDKSINFYNISDEASIYARTDTGNKWDASVACMGCSHHNIMYLSTNVIWGSDMKVKSNLDTIKASIRQWFTMFDTADRTKIKRFFNYITELNNIRLMVSLKDMLSLYVRKYRNIEYANTVDFDYIQLLDELRCPICFSRFSLYSNFSNIPVQLCDVSDKHYVCQQCFKNMDKCPICRGSIRADAADSTHIVEKFQTNVEKIEKYCFPMSLNDIHIKDNQQPFAHGAFCNIFRVDNYAIKCPRVPAQAGSDIERAIIHEIFLARPLSHIPNILMIYGGIRLPNYGASIVMEYIDGSSLATALDNDTILNMTFEERLKIALGICKGLGELHLAGIIHRDLKPANVLLQASSDGRGYIPKIADFGVSFLIQTASATAVKNSGGTVGYDAPEVADGNIPSAQSDIYALSFTLYELLTRQRPFSGLKDTQIITKFTVKGVRPQTWIVLPASKETIVVPDILKETIEKGWSAEPDSRPRIGEIIRAVRKSIKSNYRSCPDELVARCETFIDSIPSSYDFLDGFNSFELLAVQELVKRLVIEDSEAVKLLLSHYALL